jgi:hypothetical protein
MGPDSERLNRPADRHRRPSLIGDGFLGAFLWLCLMPIAIGLGVALTVGTLTGALVTLGVLLALGVWKFGA